MNEKPCTRHTIHEHQNHFGWDNSLSPVLSVAPHETVEFFPLDASGGQLTANSSVADIPRLDFTRVNPVVGPVYIDGAEPGDAVKVTLLSMPRRGTARCAARQSKVQCLWRQSSS
ncbi:acetamidase/formamidase family protein [Paraburkholderia sp. UYCP14C]|uniref:acetamidase/formamidase family protein n=1 Tax=Paraburkholderia sp. UYCP14C TaxID=2511130 RepID=UPI00200709F9|nr:acetamidase/formamidase family protein [Paraburkholderia sp. UYCP14C]